SGLTARGPTRTLGELDTHSATGPAADPGLPEAFGRYRIERVLGKGGMGAVFLAFDAQLVRHVALKVPHLAGDARAGERFLREARIAAGLRHHHLCPVYDLGEIGGVVYLTMPYFPDGSLATRLKQAGPLPPRAAL